MKSIISISKILIILSICSCNIGTEKNPTIKPDYKVIYNSNGGSGEMHPQIIKEDSKAALRANGFTKEGYYFQEWNTLIDGNGQSYLDESTYSMGNGNITLYAQWEPKPNYIITFHSNNELNETLTQVIQKDSTEQLTLNTFSRISYYFAGWNTSKSGDGHSYVDEEEFLMGDSNVILYAQWSIVPIYTITFNANGGIGTMSDQIIEESGSEQLKMNSFIRKNYNFKGWNTEKNGLGTAYNNSSTFYIGSSDITLFAQWIEKPIHSITFNSNNGSGSMPAQLLHEGENQNLYNLDFSKPDHRFKNWNTKQDGTGIQYKNIAQFTMGNEDVVLYAQWIRIITVTFKPNEGSGNMSNQLIDEDTTTSLNPNAYIRAGYVFDGWNTLVNGTGLSYSDNEPYSVGSVDIELYAQWKQVQSFRTRWRVTDNRLRIPITINNAVVDWGDGNTEKLNSSNPMHTYIDNGDYDVIISGDYREFGYYKTFSIIGEILDIKEWGGIRLHNNGYQFYRCSLLIDFSATDTLDISNITNMSHMFDKASSFNGNISDWDTTNITNMESMFSKATAFNHNIGSWKTLNVKNMKSMFSNATLFDQNIGNWNTSKVENMSYMFFYATNFNKNLPDWLTSKVTDMKYMFFYAESFNGSLKNWDTSSVSDMSFMFNYASSFNQDISSWKTFNVTYMQWMFDSATDFNQDISKWVTNKVFNMSYMFNSASSFNCGGIDISTWEWDISSCSSYYKNNIFDNTPIFDNQPGWIQ